jgi:type IV pilus biogenesis protein CpaD/CtpE
MSFRYPLVAVVVALTAALAACESPQPVPSRPANTPSAGSVDHQQREIEGRIEQAFRAGRLTQDERRFLKGQADEIRRNERRYMADGTLTRGERNLLHARLQNLSRDVDRYSERR